MRISSLFLSGIILLACGVSLGHAAKKSHVILAGAVNSGSYDFASELMRLWERPQSKIKGELELRSEESSVQRLHQLAKYEADFAIVSPDAVYSFLPQYANLYVLSVLWPNYIYVLSTHPEKRDTDLGQIKSVYHHSNSFDFVRAWQMLEQQEDTLLRGLNLQQSRRFSQNRFQEFQANQIRNILNNLNVSDLAVFKAPYPLNEINAETFEYSQLNWVHVEPALMSFYIRQQPWGRVVDLPLESATGWSSKDAGTISHALEAETLFKRQTLATYPLLVTHDQHSAKTINAILTLIYSQKKNLVPHALYQLLDGEQNHHFYRIFRYHEVAKQFFNLEVKEEKFLHAREASQPVYVQ